MNFYRSKNAFVPAMGESAGTISPSPEQSAPYIPLLAVPYVKPQKWERPYDSAAALSRGTVFPSLDLLFTGMGGSR